MSIIGECFVTSWGEASSSEFGDNDITTRELRAGMEEGRLGDATSLCRSLHVSHCQLSRVL